MSTVRLPSEEAAPPGGPSAAAPPLWQRRPGSVVLFDNASHKPSASEASQTAATLLRTLTDAGWEPRRIRVRECGMAEALPMLHDSGAHLIVAFGGDGTIAACADAAVAIDACLLAIPGGTMNLSAKDLGVWDAGPSLVGRCMLGTEHRVDAARVNGRLFLHSIATGLVPAIGRQREAFRRRRRIGGRAIALVDAARVALLHRQRPVTIRTDTGAARSESLCVVVSNNRLVRHHDIDFGRASVDAGHLGLYLSTHRGPVGRLRLMQTLLTGQLELDRGFRTASAQKVSLETDSRDIPVSIDGEILSLRAPLVVTQQPRALRVIAPGPEENRAA